MSSSWRDDGVAVAVLVLLLDLVALPHVRSGVGSFVPFLLGLELALGELRCCCCTLRSAASLMVKLQVVVLPDNAHNTATFTLRERGVNARLA